jgi:hypothetical protein
MSPACPLGRVHEASGGAVPCRRGRHTARDAAAAGRCPWPAVRTLGGSLTGPPRTGDAEAGGEDWAVLELAYPVLPAVRQLLQFGDDLEVLGPPAARRVIARAAAAVAGVYDADEAPP